MRVASVLTGVEPGAQQHAEFWLPYSKHECPGWHGRLSRPARSTLLGPEDGTVPTTSWATMAVPSSSRLLCLVQPGCMVVIPIASL